MRLSRKTIPAFLLTSFLILLPILYFPPVFNPYETPKFFFIIIISEAVFILLLLNKNKIKIDKLTAIVLAFLSIMFISNLLGLDPRISLLGTPLRHQGFVLLVSCVLIFLASRQSLEKDKAYFSRAIILSGVLISFIGAAQFILLKQFAFNIPNFDGRIVATLGNPNFLGGYLAMTLPFLYEWKFNQKIKLLLVILFWFTILITSSRSAILASIIITIIYAKTRLTKKMALSFFAATLLIVFLILSLNSTYINSLKRFSMWDNRSILWEEGIKAVSKRPILGYGQENFELIFPENRKIIVDNSHNVFLEIALSGGLIGLGLFVYLFKLGFQKKSLAIKLSLLAFLIVGFFNPLSVAQIALFWFLLGL